MMTRKLFFLTLFILTAITGLMGQNQVHVHGSVVNENGDPEENVNILISAFFADSSAMSESIWTSPEGTYELFFASPGPNVFGTVTVTMVDCWGTTISQQFVVITGDEDLQANFVYCEGIMMDSCTVIILEEWSPGSSYELIAWTPPGFDVQYAWSTGDTTQSIFPQSSGTYCVEVVFPFGCVVEDCIEVNLDSTGNCFAYIISSSNNDGTFNLEVVPSGIPPFLYSWNTGDTTQIITDVEPGTYCAVVVDSAGCVYTTCIIVDNVNFCEVYIYESPGGALTAVGFGLPPITYIWSTGDTAETIYPVDPGVYCVTMTDNNGCSVSSCYSYGIFQDSCYVFINAYIEDSLGLALQAILYTGAESWTFLWSTGESAETIYPEDPSQSYCVTVTDSDGCESSACFNSSNWCYAWIDLQYVDTSTAILTVLSDPIFQWMGANAGIYAWSTGDTTPILTVTASGDYCVTVTLGENCQAEACVTVDFEGLGVSCATWVLSYQDTAGQWFAQAYTWGPGDFQYAWSNGDSLAYTAISGPNEYICVTVASSFGCTSTACLDSLVVVCNPVISVIYPSNNSAVLTATVWNDPNLEATFEWSSGETGPSITVTEEGSYCVTVFQGGCIGTQCVDVLFTAIDTCGVWISAAPNPSGIAYTANPWGEAPFTFLWSNNDTAQTTIIDFGIHELCVTVTDANGCVSAGCNYPVDSCAVSLFATSLPQAMIAVSADQPIANVMWNTGDTLSVIQVNAPGMYCATISTIFGCVSSGCITIDSIPGGISNWISGFVFADTLSALTGYAYAYETSPGVGKAFSVVDSVALQEDGFYQMSGLPDGVYLIRVVLAPGTPGADQFIPGYHYQSTMWESGTPHVLPNWLPVTTDIHLTGVTPLEGSGVIGGIVTDLNPLLSDEEELRNLSGLPNVLILLRNAQGQALDYVWSTPDGRFRFQDLPWGTYRLRYDIPGMISPDIWVSITPDDPERLQVTLIVNSGTVAVEEPQVTKIKLYPNPAREVVHIPVPVSGGDYMIRIADMQGRIVYAGSKNNINGILSVDTEMFPGGIYIVNLTNHHGLFYGRFIKQDE